MKKIKEQLGKVKKKIEILKNKFKHLKEQYPKLLSFKGIVIELSILLTMIIISYGIGKSSEAMTISKYRDEINQQAETISKMKEDRMTLSKQKNELRDEYKNINNAFNDYKKETALFEQLTESDKEKITKELDKRKTEETAKKEEEKRLAAEAKKKKEEERLAAEEEVKKKEEEEINKVSSTEQVYGFEKEYALAAKEVNSILDNAFSNLGYFSFNYETNTFTFHITDQELKNNVVHVMEGGLPHEQWTYYITENFVGLSADISDTYGYGWFALAVANPFDSDYQLLKVIDGEIIYDFVNE